MVDTTGAPYAYAAADPVNSIDLTGLGGIGSFFHAVVNTAVTVGSYVVHHPFQDIEYAATGVCIVASDGLCLAAAEATLAIDTAHNAYTAFQNGFSLCALGRFGRSEALTAGEDLVGEGAGNILESTLPESLAAHATIDNSFSQARPPSSQQPDHKSTNRYPAEERAAAAN